MCVDNTVAHRLRKAINSQTTNPSHLDTRINLCCAISGTAREQTFFNVWCWCQTLDNRRNMW